VIKWRVFTVWCFIAKIQMTFPNCAGINLCLHSYLFPSQTELKVIGHPSDITIHMSDLNSKSSNIFLDSLRGRLLWPIFQGLEMFTTTEASELRERSFLWRRMAPKRKGLGKQNFEWVKGLGKWRTKQLNGWIIKIYCHFSNILTQILKTKKQCQQSFVNTIRGLGTNVKKCPN
jgi:hypothetical protein